MKKHTSNRLLLRLFIILIFQNQFCHSHKQFINILILFRTSLKVLHIHGLGVVLGGLLVNHAIWLVNFITH